MLTRRSCIAVACLTLVAGCLAAEEAAPAAAPERDLWYSIGDGQQPYGHMHVQVRRLADGGTEYVVESLLLLELFGERQELRSSTTAVLEPDLSLRHLESELDQMSGRTRLRVRATGDGHALEREQDGTTHRSTLARADGVPLVSDLAFGDWLQRLVVASGPEPGFTRRVRILASETGEPAEALARPAPLPISVGMPLSGCAPPSRPRSGPGPAPLDPAAPGESLSAVLLAARQLESRAPVPPAPRSPS